MCMSLTSSFFIQFHFPLLTYRIPYATIYIDIQCIVNQHKEDIL